MDTTIDDGFERKPARYTLDCAEMLDEAITYVIYCYCVKLTRTPAIVAGYR